MTKSRITN